MVKRTTWCDTLENYLFIVTLNSDVCDGTYYDIDHTLDCICRKIDSMDDDKLMFHAQETDAGGCGARNDSYSKILMLNCISLDNDFLMATCLLHGHNVTIKSQSQKLLVTFGVNFRSYFQLAFTTHALKQEFNPLQFKLSCKRVNDNECGEMIEQPILTRWETSIKACQKCLLRRLGFARSCRAIVNMRKSDNNRNKIAPGHVSLSN